jgi:hypothetical protein
VWALGVRPVAAPALVPYAFRQGWNVDPNALLYSELLAGRFSLAVSTVHARLVHELTGRYRLRTDEIVGPVRPARVRQSETLEAACRLVVRLEGTLLLAQRVEDASRTDLWSEWRRPDRIDTVRRRLGAELEEAYRLFPALEGGP